MVDSSPAPRADSSRAWRAGFGATLAAAMASSTFMQSALGTLAPFLTADLGVSRSQLGGLTTTLFLVGAAFSPLAGRIADAVGGRRILIGLFAVAGVMMAAAGLAPSYPWLLAAVALGGLAMAAGNPATNKLLSAHLPRGRQGVLTGVKQSGVQAGTFAAGAVLPPAALLIGWRGALLASSLLAVAGVAATLRVVPPDPPDADGGGWRRARPKLGPIVTRLSVYAFLMGAGVAVASTYLPLYAYERLDFSAALAGLAWATVGAVGVVARIAWGRHSDRVRDLAVPLAAIGALSVAAQLLIWGAEAAGGWMLWVGAVAFGASAASWNAVGMLAIVKRVEAADAGRASGLVQLAFYAGFVASPVAFGVSVDATGRYDLGWAVIVACYAAATVAALRWRRLPAF